MNAKELWKGILWMIVAPIVVAIFLAGGGTFLVLYSNMQVIQADMRGFDKRLARVETLLDANYRNVGSDNRQMNLVDQNSVNRSKIP